jgi:U3 small nucleolar RNA-associated protein 13
LVSSGADGLIKLWTVRTNECETTLDGHSDKVWALDLAHGGTEKDGVKKDLLVSGGADSKIVVWEDTTAQLEAEERAQQAESILLDQQMANHLRHKEYDKALEIALKVDKPMQAYKVLAAMLENEISSKNKPQLTLQQHVSKWDLDRVAQVLKYCRDWNTRARNAPLAMWVLQAVVKTIPVDKLASREATKCTHGNIPELLAGITPYAERHFDRLDRLHTSAYLLDYLLFNMSSLDPLGVDDAVEESFAQWEAKSKLVLPPKYVDGRIQIGGKALIGVSEKHIIGGDDGNDSDNSDIDEEMDDEVVTVGDSDSSSDDDDDDDDDDKNDVVMEKVSKEDAAESAGIKDADNDDENNSSSSSSDSEQE